MQATVEDQIRTYLAEQFVMGSDDELPSNEDSLSETGVVDSAGVLALVLFLEEAFGITVEDDDVHPDNLDSVAQIAEFVRGKQMEAAKEQ